MTALNDVEDFNWMGYGNDPREVEAGFHKVNLGLPPLTPDTNIDKYLEAVTEVICSNKHNKI